MEIPLTSDQRFRQQRRSLLSRHPVQCGIEFVQARQENAAWILEVYFVPVDPAAATGKEAVPAGLQAGDFRISRLGGTGPVPQIEDVVYPPAASDSLVLRLGDVPAEDEAGGPGIAYILTLTGSCEVNPGFAQSLFSLRENASAPTPEAGRSRENDPAQSADIHYLAKDYQSFYTLMLNRLSLTLPKWQERHAADMGIALVELLAYAGDYLSYYQDAVGTEAYLGTARRRISLRRHTRLLDYAVNDGCNARVWLQLCVEGDRVRLPAGAAFTVAAARGHTYTHGIEAQPVFESMHDADLWAAHNELPIYCWGVDDYSLEPGATSAALRGTYPQLQAGDVILFEETCDPRTGESAGADPRRRHVVRLLAAPDCTTDVLTGDPITLIAWEAQDALPFRLAVSALLPSGQAGTGLARACGNVVLADHGATQPTIALPRGAEARKAALPMAGVIWAGPYEHQTARTQPAAATLEQCTDRALPCLKLTEWRGDSLALPCAWEPRRDLLSSDAYDRHFVAEVESDDQIFVRFGDGDCGRSCPADALLTATFRVGTSADGNIAADTLVHPLEVNPQIVSVRNPLPAHNPMLPETTNHIRLQAPEKLRLHRHCVTADDYADAACEHPEVRLAAARQAWTGSERLVSIYVVRRGGWIVTPAFEQELVEFLEPRRLLGAEFEIRPARYVSLFLALRVVLQPGHAWAAVRSALAAALSDRKLPDGTWGFFYPDNFAFGQTLYLSEILACGHAVPGVARLDAAAFQPWRRDAARRVHESISLRELELPRLANDPTQPQHGLLELSTEEAG